MLLLQHHEKLLDIERGICVIHVHIDLVQTDMQMVALDSVGR